MTFHSSPSSHHVDNDASLRELAYTTVALQGVPSIFKQFFTVFVLQPVSSAGSQVSLWSSSHGRAPLPPLPTPRMPPPRFARL